MLCTIDKIDTPAVLIEKSILEKNISSMQKLADDHQINLRVHIKSHKIPELALIQLEAGAVGIAVAKLGEAEVMAKAGIKDIQIANIIVGEKKIAQLKALSRICRLAVATDSLDNAAQLSRAFASSKRPLDLFVKVDTGLGRSGFNSLKKVKVFLEGWRRKKLNGIRLVGLLTHAGHAYGASCRREIKEIGRAEGMTPVRYAARLKKAGWPVGSISVGSTPTAKYAAVVPGVTELRVGNYIFHDMTQVALGTVPLGRCALSVLATIISRPTARRAVIDAGSKAFGLDRGAHGRQLLKGYGRLIGSRAIFSRLSEEHGIIEPAPPRLRVGDRVRIIPNHACIVMNLFDYAYLVDKDRVLVRYEITARGKME